MMNNSELQKHLTYIAKVETQALRSKNIKGVTAFWKDDIAYVSVYFDENPSEDELENVSDMCTEIIAHMPKGKLEEKYFVLTQNDPLPEEFLAYKRDE